MTITGAKLTDDSVEQWYTNDAGARVRFIRMLKLDFTEDDVRKGKLYVEEWDPIVAGTPDGEGTITRGLLREDGTDDPWMVTWETSDTDNRVYTTQGTWENMPDAIMRKCLDQETPLRGPMSKKDFAAHEKRLAEERIALSFLSAGWKKLKEYVEENMKKEKENMEKGKDEMTKVHRLVDAGLEPVDIIEGIAYLDKIECNKIILGTSSRKRTNNVALFDWFEPVRAKSHTKAWMAFLEEICAAMTDVHLPEVARQRLLQHACVVGPGGPGGADDSAPVQVEDL